MCYWGSITVTATGGFAPYTFALDNNAFQSSPIFSNLSAGSYSVKVKDKNNCLSTITDIILSAPGGPVFGSPAFTTEPDTRCDGDDGSITINATGPAGVLTYSITGSSFQSGNVFSSLRAGSYTVMVKDADGCEATVVAEVPNLTGISYVGEVKPIFQTKCALGGGCHPANGDWFTYSVAKNKAATIKTRINLPDGNPSKMPKTGSLTIEELATINCWVDHGAPKN